MKFELFVTLYNEALEYKNVDMYIADRGWQDWMENFPEDKLGGILKAIYTLADQSIKEMREERGISRARFSRSYDIKLRTLENWDSGTNTTQPYTKMLIAYTFFMDDLLNRGD
ncbi:hypothetical protein JZO78_04215 [Enterococcus ureilyticus]|uniref:hypothetical protein n=1 Tax=Enterococcus ureilyticus TaxID=1131292 RepID=UPI001A92034B|nr:hypothetical protein [Enterococcus ureilyticus]MBO0445539.1 hypothetical protein [Enterococcus ureilyticus]